LNQPIADIIKQRFSCRTYLDKPIELDLQRTLTNFFNSNRIGPLGTRARLRLVTATDHDHQSLKGLGTYGFIKNATGFIVGALEQGLKDLEDFGYLMEHAVLFATDLGLGTCWLGGSFTKSSFAKKISAAPTERVPAVISIGYSASNDNIRGLIRKRAGAQHRFPKEWLFFDKMFGNILIEKESSAYTDVLEMVRWAPSASNKQPWRIIRNENRWHFYLQRTKDYGKGTLVFKFLQLADLQRVDMGIAMCHFDLAAREYGLQGSWVIDDPKLSLPDNTEYIVSWVSPENQQFIKES
jgi:nitroreductase